MDAHAWRKANRVCELLDTLGDLLENMGGTWKAKRRGATQRSGRWGSRQLQTLMLGTCVAEGYKALLVLDVVSRTHLILWEASIGGKAE